MIKANSVKSSIPQKEMDEFLFFTHLYYTVFLAGV